MKRNNNISNGLHNIMKRGSALILSILMTMMMLAPVNAVYAAGDADDAGSSSEAEAATVPIREVHRVKVGDNKYCLFVTHNVVMTPEEIQKMSDNELTTEIVSRAGLFMRETNCRKPSHKVITANNWIKSGGSFSLSDRDIDALRSAAPSDGSPVKLHMDLGVSTDPYETEEDSRTDEGTGTENSKPDEGAGTGDSTEVNQPAESDDDKDNTGDAKTDDSSASGKTADGTGIGGSIEVNKTAESGGDKDGTGDAKTDDSSASGKTADGTEAGENKDSAKTGSDTAAKKSTRKIYSTSKLLSPELLFVAVATASDAKTGEDVCTIKSEDDGIKNPGNIDIPDAGDAEADTMLPEYRTIQMADRTGKPLEPTLQDGTPVSLKWIEPSKGIDTDNISEHIPAGLIGAIAALAIAAAATVVIIIRRRSSYEEYEDEE